MQGFRLYPIRNFSMRPRCRSEIASIQLYRKQISRRTAQGFPVGQPCVCEMVIFNVEELIPDHADWQRLIRACLQLYVGKGKRIAYAGDICGASTPVWVEPLTWPERLRCGLLNPSEVYPRPSQAQLKLDVSYHSRQFQVP